MVNRRGVILVDVLVAVVLLGSALALLLGMSGRAVSAQRSGENLQTAAMLLDEKLNLVLARGADSYASRFADEMTGAFDAPFDRYHYQLELSGGSGGDAFKVVATVWWDEDGKRREAAIETRIAPRLGDEPDPDRRPAESPERLGGVGGVR